MKNKSVEMDSSSPAVFESPIFELTIIREEDAMTATKEFKEHVIAGLSKPTKALSSMYFYDDRGSGMFLLGLVNPFSYLLLFFNWSTLRTPVHTVTQQIDSNFLLWNDSSYALLLELYAKITELDQYYLTRTERQIFETYGNDIVKHFSSLGEDAVGETINVVELGAGDGRKTKILLEALLAHGVNFEYIPVDISRKAMGNLFEAMGTFFKNKLLRVHGLVGDYLECVQHVVSAHPLRRTAVLFIGSSIGNFSIDSAVSFLKELRTKLHPQDLLLLGTDLRKDTETMTRAYSDSEGVTKDFNFNLLTRMNRELGTNFNLDNFEHLAVYNSNIGAMESYLLATKPHRVSMKSEELAAGSKGSGKTAPAHEFAFGSFERLHMECAHKYTIELVNDMLESAGYHMSARYFDKHKWFMDSVSVVPDV